MDNHWFGGEGEEYETQHFRFGRQRFKIAMRQMIKEKIESGLHDMVNQLQEQLALNEKDNIALKRSFQKLVRLYSNSSGQFLENIDKEIDQMLRVPKNILLPEDEVQLQQPTDEQYNGLQQEILSLQKGIERCALMEKILTEELNELSTAEKLCEAVKVDVKVLDSISNICEEDDNVQKVIDITQSLCESMPYICSMEMNDMFDENI